MSTKTKEPLEGDVIVARALSSYAQLRANIAKWSGLPAGSVSTTAEPENEDEELFTAESETAGVGYVAPQDGERTKTSTDKLRKQMLGKRARGAHSGLERVGGPKQKSIPRNSVSRGVGNQEDSEEDEGRSAVGKKRKNNTVPVSDPDSKDIAGDTDGADSESKSVSKKPPSSYLDELLAKRSKKRKKQKQTKDPE